MNTVSSSAFFEAKYQADDDPWDFASNDYELRRYDAILNSLKGSRYRSAIEPGCSVGVLTAGLSNLCDHLLAFDFSRSAVDKAIDRCGDISHVELAWMSLDDIESFAPFDLVVLSEIGYYFTEVKWRHLAQRIVAEMQMESTLLAAHWTGISADHEISGDLVHEILLADPCLQVQRSERHVGFRLERWGRI